MIDLAPICAISQTYQSSAHSSAISFTDIVEGYGESANVDNWFVVPMVNVVRNRHGSHLRCLKR